VPCHDAANINGLLSQTKSRRISHKSKTKN
jgi:hypothetical protein